MNKSSKSLLAGIAIGLTAFTLIACADINGSEVTHPDIVAESPDFIQSVEGVPVPEGAEIIMEDDSRFDCRVMGNEACGTQIEGVWYIVQFEDGTPVSVTTRANQ